MSSIDQVIARSRQKGGFSERKSFTVARQRAIRKMREFALADPHYYILELIQSAVANGANYIDIHVTSKAVTTSYVGGYYLHNELAQLFDFLFASKDKLEHGHVRELALGINALLLFEPEMVVVESGDGTRDGSTRLELRGSSEQVIIGKPARPLRGTFVKAVGLKRSKIRSRSVLPSTPLGPPECTAIEERCLSAPVPIIVNNEALFGFAKMRMPNLFGYRNEIAFDEGDLYGTIGVPFPGGTPTFKLLTWGVWLQSVVYELVQGRQVGGIVCFDRLRKTADHSGVVQDDRLAELWLRLRPYAQELFKGSRDKKVGHIRLLDGETVPRKELRQLLRENPEAVAVTRRVGSHSSWGRLAKQIGEALDCLVFVVDPVDLPSIKLLGGSDCQIHYFDTIDPDDVAHYSQPKMEPPSQPWLTGPVKVDGIALEELRGMLTAEQPLEEKAEEALMCRLAHVMHVNNPGKPSKDTDGDDDKRPAQHTTAGGQRVTATVYTPARDPDVRAGTSVNVLLAERLVWSGVVEEGPNCHHLDVSVPDMPRDVLCSPVKLVDGSSRMLAELIAEISVAHAAEGFETASQRALDGLGTATVEPHTPAARLVLSALSRHGLLRLRRSRSDGEPPRVALSLLESTTSLDLLEVPALANLDGDALSAHQLNDVLSSTFGLLHWVDAGEARALGGLNAKRILRLDWEDWQDLVAVLGEAVFAAVGQPPVASHNGLHCKEIALGLRDYPDFPLLVEDGDPSEWNEPRRNKALRSLIRQLIAVFEDNGQAESDIRRRIACRHLQWFVCHLASTDPSGDDFGTFDIPLFLHADGYPLTFRTLKTTIDVPREIVMFDGRAVDMVSGIPKAAVETALVVDAGKDPLPLAMNPFVCRLLAPLTPIGGLLDFDLSHREAEVNPSTPEVAFLLSARIDKEGCRGVVGIPEVPVDDPAIALVEPNDKKVRALRRMAREHGVVGYLHVSDDLSWGQLNQIASMARLAAESVLASLADELPHRQSDVAFCQRATRILLDYAAKQLLITTSETGNPVPKIRRPLAEWILDLPVFPTKHGSPVSAHRLTREFCAAGGTEPVCQQTDGRWSTPFGTELSSDMDPYLLQWLQRVVNPKQVGPTPAKETDGSVAPMPIVASPDNRVLLEHTLKFWLEHLRPDEPTSFDDAGQPLALDILVAKDSDHLDLVRYSNFEKPFLELRASHPMVMRALQRRKDDQTSLAWLLFACYAHLNYLLEPVTNEHELVFQRRVLAAFKKGELGWVDEVRAGE